MAPFWGHIDTRRGGTLSHETFESGYYLEQVNAYIQRRRQNTFQGTWMMNVYYKEVAPFYATSFSGSGSGVSDGSGEVSGCNVYDNTINKL